MTASPEPQQHKRILNPFLFPSETNVRFVLLVAAALILSFNEGMSLALELNLAEAPLMPSMDIPFDDPEAVQLSLRAWGQAWFQSLRFLALPLGLMISVLLLSMLVYWGHARRIRRAKNLRVFTRDQDPQFMDAIHELAAQSGVSPAPRIETAPHSQSIDGQAFGFRNHYALRLGGRVRLLFRKNPAYFRALILHELAHIANADIARTYFAQAVWFAMTLLVIIPAAAFILYQFFVGVINSASNLPDTGWLPEFSLALSTTFILLLQLGGTIAIVAATRSSLLRTREIYADWRTAVWGAQAPLMDILRRHNKAEENKGLRTLWRLHPTAQERLAALESPMRLFRVSAELPLLVGVLLGIAVEGFFTLGGGLIYILTSSVMIGVLQVSKFIHDLSLLTMAALLGGYTVIGVSILIVVIIGFWFGYLMAGALGVQIQREAMADLSSNRRGISPYLKLWKPAVFVAVGFQLGVLLTPKSILGLLPSNINLVGLYLLLMMIFFTAITAFLTWLWLVFARFYAMRVFGSTSSATVLQRSRRLLTLVLTGLLFVLFVPVVVAKLFMDVAAVNDVAFSEQLWVVFTITFRLAAFLYLLAFGAGLVLLFLLKMIWKPRCPACQTTLQPRFTFGQLCTRCGQDPAPWLFVPYRSLL